jgi:taurine transport system permease protein
MPGPEIGVGGLEVLSTTGQKPRPNWRGVVNKILWHPVVRSCIALVLVVSLWELIVILKSPSPLALPSPGRVVLAAQQMLNYGFGGTSLLGHIAASFRRVGLGFALSVAVGVPLGLTMGISRTVRNGVTPYFSLFRPVPPFAWLAMFVVWLGIGEAPKVLIIFVGSVTIIALNTMDGVRRIPPQFSETARTLGASRFQSLQHVFLPAAVPQMISGGRVALLVAWTAVLAAELVAAHSGIGVIILDSSNFLRTDQTFLGILLIAVCGGITDWIMARLQSAVEPWGNR